MIIFWFYWDKYNKLLKFIYAYFFLYFYHTVLTSNISITPKSSLMTHSILLLQSLWEATIVTIN